MFSAIFFLLDYRLLLWRRSGKEVDGDRVWKNLRMFSSWMCAGCLAGAIAFVTHLQWRNFEYAALFALGNFEYGALDSRISRRQFYELQASANRWYAAFNIFYPVHRLCITHAMNTLLRRVSDHASHSYYNVARDIFRDDSDYDNKRFDWRDCVGEYALYYWVRTMHRVSMLICSLLIVARIAGAVFTAKMAELFGQAAAATDLQGRDTDTSQSIYTIMMKDAEKDLHRSLTVSRCIECAVLILVLSGFLLFFPSAIIMFRRVEQKLAKLIMEMDHRSDVGNALLPAEFSPRAADGSVTQTEMPIVEVRRSLREIQSSAASQKKRFLFCLVYVIIALVAVLSLSLFIAVWSQNLYLEPGCNACDPSCQKVEYLMYLWYRFSPEIFPLVTFLSSTLPLVLSLWLMTTPEDRKLLMYPSRFLSERISMEPIATTREERLKEERIRLGIYL